MWSIDTALPQDGGDPSERAGLIRISTCQTAIPARTVGFAARASRARLAASNVSSTPAAGRRRSWHGGLPGADEQIDRLGDRSRFGEQDLAPQRRVRRGQARKVAEPARGQQEESAPPPPRCAAGPSGPWRRPAADGSRRHEPVVPSGPSRRAGRRADPSTRGSATVAAGSVSGTGVRTQTIPSTTEAEACSGPARSVPPIG